MKLPFLATRRCGPQKLCTAAIHALRPMTIIPQVCDPVFDAESRSSLQPAADHI
jgi:hypothetical protein